MQQKRIVVQDSKALAHMVKNGYDYPKNNIVRGEMGRALGHGLLYVEGNHLLYLHIFMMLRRYIVSRGQPQTTTQDAQPGFLAK
jgi:hypothetical protein